MSAWHQVAHAPGGLQPFGAPEAAASFWRSLRKACTPRGTHLPACAALMPDHVHLVHFADPVRIKRSLARLVVGFGRRWGFPDRWHVPAPMPIAGPAKLLRQLRYVHLNPCRSGLARDPLSWPWSTHRDSIGAVYDPWLRLSELDLGLAPRGESLECAFHRYVSADPSVHPEGSGFPVQAPLRAIPHWGLIAIWRAVVAASPWCNAPRLRERFALLAWHQGWRDSTRVAQVAGIQSAQVRRLHRRLAQIDLAPAILCLDDARLRVGASKMIDFRSFLRS